MQIVKDQYNNDISVIKMYDKFFADITSPHVYDLLCVITINNPGIYIDKTIQRIRRQYFLFTGNTLHPNNIQYATAFLYKNNIIIDYSTIMFTKVISNSPLKPTINIVEKYLPSFNIYALYNNNMIEVFKEI